MDNKKLLWGSVALIGVAALGFIAYYAYSKSRTKSGNPEKDNRQVIQNLVK